MSMTDLAIRTLFAEFQEAVFKRYEIFNGIKGEWTFIGKKLKGKKYWYQQRYIDGKVIQKYFAPSGPDVDKEVLGKRTELNEKRKLLKSLIASEKRRAAMLKKGGLPFLDHLGSVIIEALSDNLLTYKNGVLIGSYAFAAYSGLLGVSFENKSLKTNDIDVAIDPSIELSHLQPVNIEELLRKIDAHFRPVPSLSTKYAPHSFIGPSGMRVDVVAPLRGKPRGDIKLKKITGSAAEPLRFLDFLLEEVVDTVLLSPKGGIPVTVPHPARYAIHKLIVSSYRSVTEGAKKEKDISQAGQLIAVCKDEYEIELLDAYKDAMSRGPKWKIAISKGIDALTRTSFSSAIEAFIGKNLQK